MEDLKLFQVITYKNEKAEVVGGKLDEKGFIYFLRIDRGIFNQILEVREEEIVEDTKWHST